MKKLIVAGILFLVTFVAYADVSPPSWSWGKWVGTRDGVAFTLTFTSNDIYEKMNGRSYSLVRNMGNATVREEKRTVNNVPVYKIDFYSNGKKVASFYFGWDRGSLMLAQFDVGNTSTGQVLLVKD